MATMEEIRVPYHGYRYLPEESDLDVVGKGKEVFAKHIRIQENNLLGLSEKSTKSCLPLQKYKQTFSSTVFVAYSDYLPEDADRELTSNEALAYKEALNGLSLSSCVKISTKPVEKGNGKETECCKPNTSADFNSNTNTKISLNKTVRVVLHDISQNPSSSIFLDNKNSNQSGCSSSNLSEEEFRDSNEDTFQSVFQPLSTHLANLTQIYGTDSLLSGYLKK